MKVDVQAARMVVGSRYPTPFDGPCAARVRRCLGDGAGLTQFGVNLMRLPAGAWSSQRHWHSAEDEFVFVLEGEIVLVTDTGEQILSPGDCAGFKAGTPDGHHFQNRGTREALFLEIGSRRQDDEVIYSDIDLKTVKGREGYAHRSGEPYASTGSGNPATGV